LQIHVLWRNSEMSSFVSRFKAGTCVAALFLALAGISYADEPDSDTSTTSEAVPKWRLRILQLETIWAL